MGAKHYIFAPKIGIRAPAASGMRPVLYANAQKRFCLIFDMVVSTKLYAITALLTSPIINMIALVSFAISLPEPMAIPKSALARAGASFMPLQPAQNWTWTAGASKT
jgi:hypothetical protein